MTLSLNMSNLLCGASVFSALLFESTVEHSGVTIYCWCIEIELAYLKNTVLNIYLFLCVWLFFFSVWISVPHLHAVPLKARKGVGFPGIGVICGCETPCGCWKLNPGSPGRVARYS